MPIHFYGVLPWGPTRHEVVPNSRTFRTEVWRPASDTSASFMTYSDFSLFDWP